MLFNVMWNIRSRGRGKTFLLAICNENRIKGVIESKYTYAKIGAKPI
jgi:hypothetical protein